MRLNREAFNRGVRDVFTLHALRQWFTAFRIRRLRKAKLIRVQRFQLAMKHGDMVLATKHRKALRWYKLRLEHLTGEPEPLMA